MGMWLNRVRPCGRVTATQSSPSATKKMGGRAEACRPKETDMLNVIQEATQGKTAAKVKTTFDVIRDILRDGGPVKISASQAGLIYRECRYWNQDRDLKKAGQDHIKVLTEMMRRGDWREKDTLQFACLDGSYTILNGHHRLGAQEASGKTLLWNVTVYQASDIAAIDKLYTTFDTNVRMRSNEQILNALDLTDELGLPRQMVEALYRAVPLVNENLKTGAKDRDVVTRNAINQRVAFMRNLAPQARLLEQCIEKAAVNLKKRLMSQGAFSVALITLKYQEATAVEFWRGVAENDGLRVGDPRRAYVTSLLETARFGNSAKNTVAVAAAAWNAWYSKRRANFFKPGSATTIRLLGTPLDKA